MLPFILKGHHDIVKKSILDSFHQERSVHTLEGHPLSSLEALIQRRATVSGPSEPIFVQRAISDGVIFLKNAQGQVNFTLLFIHVVVFLMSGEV